MSSNDNLGFTLLINTKKIKNNKNTLNNNKNINKTNKINFIEYIDTLISSSNNKIISDNENLFWEQLRISANNIIINFEKYLNRKID